MAVLMPTRPADGLVQGLWGGFPQSEGFQRSQKCIYLDSDNVKYDYHGHEIYLFPIRILRMSKTLQRVVVFTVDDL